METGHIEDYQISSSSFWKFEHKSYDGRLQSHSSWIPDITENEHFLTVDFLHTTMLTGIITQGGFMLDNFVTGFKFSLKNGDDDFVPYQENGQEKVNTYSSYLAMHVNKYCAILCASPKLILILDPWLKSVLIKNIYQIIASYSASSHFTVSQRSILLNFLLKNNFIQFLNNFCNLLKIRIQNVVFIPV